MTKEIDGPKILFCDIETLPIEAYVWALFDQSPGISMMKTDWTLLSWSAKWRHSKHVYYEDVRARRNKRDDKQLLKGIWKLLDDADIVIWQNGKSFDHKKLNARFILNDMKPPSPYKQIDTKVLAKRHFGFTSNRLEYLAEKLNKTHRKDKHKKFNGFELWKECLAGNTAAFNEMELYNRKDVLALEELYLRLEPWDRQIDFNVYRSPITNKCNCGSSNLQRRGFSFTSVGKYQRYQCQDCGAWSSDKGQANNALEKDKRDGLKRRVT